jgi:hypothetical protein
MKYSLRSLMIVVAVAPPLLGAICYGCNYAWGTLDMRFVPPVAILCSLVLVLVTVIVAVCAPDLLAPGQNQPKD